MLVQFVIICNEDASIYKNTHLSAPYIIISIWVSSVTMPQPSHSHINCGASEEGGRMLGWALTNVGWVTKNDCLMMYLGISPNIQFDLFSFYQ